MVPADHPFIDAASLEVEGATLLRRLITDFLYTKQYVGSVVNRNFDERHGSYFALSRNPDLISAILNSLSNLVKLRPGFVQGLVSSLTLWTPAPLMGLPYASIRSAEKSVRILLTHISRCVRL